MLRGILLASLLGSLLLTACREPTEITLQIRTNVRCDGKSWRGVAVYVGEPGEDAERAAPTLVTTQCDEQGYIGSLVVVPSGSKQSEVGVRVVAGLEREPEACADADYQGCIVSRRSLRFTPHSSLQLDVTLAADCVSVGCDPLHTCADGSCVDTARTLTMAAPDVPPLSGPTVHCGDNGAVCGTTGDVCCLAIDVEQGTTHGDCRPAKDCPVASAVLRCDDDTDCPRDPVNDYAGVCLLSFVGGDIHNPGRVTLAQCLYAQHDSAQGAAGLTLCQERVPCVDQFFPCLPTAGGGNPNPLPGYYWCKSYFP